MAIKAVVDSLESVDESLRDHYKEQDGRYVLSVEAAEIRNGDRTHYFALEDINGLRSGLQSERANARKLAERAALFGDLDPSKVKSSLEELETLRSQSGDLEEKAGKLAQSKIEQIVSKHQQEVATREKTIASYRSKVERLLVTDALSNAIRAAGGDEDTVALLQPHLQAHVSLREVGNDFIAEVVDPLSKEPRIGDTQGNAMSLEQLVNEFKAKDRYAIAFPGSGRSGGGTPSSNSGRGASKYPERRGEFSVEQRTKFIDEKGALAWINLKD